MLQRIGSADDVPGLVQGGRDGDRRLMGCGHQLYRNTNPRAKIPNNACDEVFAVPERTALGHRHRARDDRPEDEYFVSRKLNSHVDLLRAIYEALGDSVEMSPVLFAIGRTSGGPRSGWR